MNMVDYITGLKKAKQQIVEALPAIADEIAVSSLSVVKDRSTNEGILIDGKPGTKQQYSTNPIPTSYFTGKELNNAGRAYIKANKTGTWGKFRKAQGRSDDAVNLGYTMRMWTGIQVIRTNQVGTGKYESVVGAADQETRDKVAANVKRYGMFLDPTPDEQQLAQEKAKERLLSIITGI